MSTLVALLLVALIGLSAASSAGAGEEPTCEAGQAEDESSKFDVDAFAKFVKHAQGKFLSQFLTPSQQRFLSRLLESSQAKFFAKFLSSAQLAKILSKFLKPAHAAYLHESLDAARDRMYYLHQRLLDFDPDSLFADAKEASTVFFDKMLLGNSRSRGELYGAIQLVLLALLLRPGVLDWLVWFVCGPLVLALGAVISGKSLIDLGYQQYSIWPAPTLDGELRTSGLYEFVRHPLYCGVILLCAGFAVWTRSPGRVAIAVAITAVLLKKIEVEEELLAYAYPAYQAYRRRVTSRILPGIL